VRNHGAGARTLTTVRGDGTLTGRPSIGHSVSLALRHDEDGARTLGSRGERLGSRCRVWAWGPGLRSAAIRPNPGRSPRLEPARRRAEARALFEAEDIRDWRGHNVVDPDGSKIGSLEAVYFDTATEQPTFATVKVGMVGRHRLVFVPLFEARVSPDHVRVTTDKKLVMDAPSIDTDGELTAAEEPAVFAHYGLQYQPGTSGERRLGRR
jgi:hypothetical protein